MIRALWALLASVALLHDQDAQAITFAVLAVAYANTPKTQLWSRLRRAIDDHNRERARARSAQTEYRMSEPPVER